jgi:hypothetical protein
MSENSKGTLHDLPHNHFVHGHLKRNICALVQLNARIQRFSSTLLKEAKELYVKTQLNNTYSLSSVAFPTETEQNYRDANFIQSM